MEPTNARSKDPDFWSFRSFRHGLTWVMCLATLAVAWCRNALSMAMVCMVNATALAVAKQAPVATVNMTSIVVAVDKEEISQCGELSADVAVDYGGELVWNSAQQGLLFSAIFWGSAIVGLPSGWLISRFGSKHIVSGCLLLTLVATLLTPVAAIDGGLWPTFVVRLIMGFGGQIVLNIAMTVIMSKWIPPAERSTVLAVFTSGNQIAGIVGMPVNAALCRHRNFLGGWPAIFYVSGAIILVAGVLWEIFVHDSPKQSRWISKAELQFIEESLQSQGMGARKDATQNIPWRRIFTSHVLWSCIGVHFATGIIATIIATYIPTYYKEVLKIDLQQNGFFSALPFIAQWVSKMIFAVAADAMKKHTRISHTVICKVFNSIGTIVASIFLVACAFMSCNRVAWAITLLSLANAAYSGLVPGAMTALVCFAPAYIALVNGAARFAGQVASVVAPYIVGAVTRDGTADEWQTVFYVMGAVTTLFGIYFLLCGSVEIQDWAKLDGGDQKIINALNNGKSTSDGGKAEEKAEQILCTGRLPHTHSGRSYSSEFLSKEAKK